jgi:hypothetical protein
MKTISLTTLLIISFSAFAQDRFAVSTRESIRFPKESALLTIKDSILIGKNFVAVKGQFFSQFPLDNLNGATVSVKNENAKQMVSLSSLTTNFQLLSSDPNYPVVAGWVAFLKPDNAAASSSFFVNFPGLKALPGAETLQPGDYVVFYGLLSFNGKKEKNFPLKWYKVTK